MGQDHQVMLIGDMEQTDYVSVVAKIMTGGACTDIKTVTCYTGAQAQESIAKALLAPSIVRQQANSLDA